MMLAEMGLLLLLPLPSQDMVVGSSTGHPMGRAECGVMTKCTGAVEPTAPQALWWAKTLCCVQAVLLLPGVESTGSKL